MELKNTPHIKTTPHLFVNFIVARERGGDGGRKSLLTMLLGKRSAQIMIGSIILKQPVRLLDQCQQLGLAIDEEVGAVAVIGQLLHLVILVVTHAPGVETVDSEKDPALLSRGPSDPSGPPFLNPISSSP